MDEHNTQEQDELLDTNSELEDTYSDDDMTPADTEQSDEPKRETAAEVKERQKQAWIKKVKEDPKALDEMPQNLGWLKKRN